MGVVNYHTAAEVQGQSEPFEHTSSTFIDFFFYVFVVALL